MEEKTETRKRKRMWPWFVGGAAVLVLLLAAGGWFLWHKPAVLMRNIEPMLRARVIDSLATRFQSRVELGEFHVSVNSGLEVTGGGLQLFPYNRPGADPLIAVDHFSFRTTWDKVTKQPTHIDHVQVEGLHINLPPKVEGQPRISLPHQQKEQAARQQDSSKKISIIVDELDCTNATLVFRTNNPGKVPLDFEIQKLTMQRVGAGLPMKFQATLTNPKPVGQIESSGNIGPWNTDTPGETPVDGSYEFSEADLSTLKGISGILSSTGKYAGTLNNIVADGETDTPDFKIASGGRPVALHTKFHAIVDGMNGDTYLQPVNASFLHTHLTAVGKVVRVPGVHGHDIQLDVTVDRGRIEDLLRLGVRTDPPVMNGSVKLKTKFALPPGKVALDQKLRLNGTFEVEDAHFPNESWQAKVDTLSRLGQGIEKKDSPDAPENVASQMQGKFQLADGRLTLTDLDYKVPGSEVLMDGVYSLDGNLFDFHGKVRMQAKLSDMTSGWKSALLKPIDPFFSKHGAGTELPIKISGTKSEPKFGLDFGHKDKEPVKEPPPSR